MKMADPVAHIVKKLQVHWGAKLDKGLTVIAPETRTQLERWLKPTFHGVKSLRSDRKARESKMIALLEFQLKFIRSALDNERILCEGGAGTGKTLIGIEYLRIQTERGVCSSPLLLAPQNVCSRPGLDPSGTNHLATREIVGATRESSGSYRRRRVPGSHERK